MQLLQIGEGLEQRVQQQTVPAELLRLLQIRERLSPQDPDVARVGRELARQQPQRRGLALAVRSHQGQAVPGPDEQRGPREDVGAGITEMDVGELGEGHRGILGGGDQGGRRFTAGSRARGSPW